MSFAIIFKLVLSADIVVFGFFIKHYKDLPHKNELESTCKSTVEALAIDHASFCFASSNCASTAATFDCKEDSVSVNC